MGYLFNGTSQFSNEDESTKVVPAGWLAIKELNKEEFKKSSHNDETFVAENLLFAAKIAERLIVVLSEVPGIPVLEAYLRPVDTASFHLLLLISQEDFLSPYINAARIVANKYATYETFDMRVTFSILAGNVKNTPLMADAYLLKPQEHLLQIAHAS